MGATKWPLGAEQRGVAGPSAVGPNVGVGYAADLPPATIWADPARQKSVDLLAAQDTSSRPSETLRPFRLSRPNKDAGGAESRRPAAMAKQLTVTSSPGVGPAPEGRFTIKRLAAWQKGGRPNLSTRGVSPDGPASS